MLGVIPHRLDEGYGLSETAPVATANPTNTRQRKIGSIGFPLPGTDIKVVERVPEGQAWFPNHFSQEVNTLFDCVIDPDTKVPSIRTTSVSRKVIPPAVSFS